MDSRLPVVETARDSHFKQRTSKMCRSRWGTVTGRFAHLSLSSASAASHFSKRPVMSVGARRMSLTFRKNSCASSQAREYQADHIWTNLRAPTYIHELLILDGGLHRVGGIIQGVFPGMHQESQTELSSWKKDNSKLQEPFQLDENQNQLVWIDR